VYARADAARKAVFFYRWHEDESEHVRVEEKVPEAIIGSPLPVEAEVQTSPDSDEPDTNPK
jgi:hypothetical protein